MVVQHNFDEQAIEFIQGLREVTPDAHDTEIVFAVEEYMERRLTHQEQKMVIWEYAHGRGGKISPSNPWW
jgi:hypothetical protein